MYSTTVTVVLSQPSYSVDGLMNINIENVVSVVSFSLDNFTAS